MQNLKIYDLLFYFTTLVEQGEFKKTCEMIGIDFKTLKKKIEDLEATLKLKLIQTNSKELEITESGKKLYSLVSDDFSALNQTFDDFKQLNNNAEIFILLTPVPALYFSTFLLPIIEKEYPAISINIDSLSYGFMLEQGNYLRKIIKKYDIVMLNKRIMHIIDDESWLLSKAFTDRSYLYASEEYLAKNPVNKLEDLQSHRLITLDCLQDINNLKFRQNDESFVISCHNVLPVEDDLMNMYLVQSSVGVGIFREITLKTNKNHKLLRVLPDYELLNDNVYHLIYKTNSFNNSNVKKVIEIFKQQFPL